jgi:ABC-type arginine/histidine transport system permease subunit
MDQIQFYEAEPIPKSSIIRTAIIKSTSNSWVNKVTLTALQITVTICVFEGIRRLIFEDMVSNYNIFIIIAGLAVAILCTFMIMLKYQILIQQLGRRNDKLEESLGERISELVKANEEMRLELARRKLAE